MFNINSTIPEVRFFLQQTQEAIELFGNKIDKEAMLACIDYINSPALTETKEEIIRMDKRTFEDFRKYLKTLTSN